MLPPATKKSGFPGQAGSMPQVEIIRQAVMREGGGDFDTFMKKLASVLQDPNNKLIQFGNTIFLLKKVDPTTTEVHTLSSEPPEKLIQAFQGLAKALKREGLHKAVSYAPSPAYAKMIKAAGLNVKVGQGAKVLKGKGQPVYTFEVTL